MRRLATNLLYVRLITRPFGSRLRARDRLVEATCVLLDPRRRLSPSCSSSWLEPCDRRVDDGPPGSGVLPCHGADDLADLAPGALMGLDAHSRLWHPGDARRPCPSGPEQAAVPRVPR